MISNEKNNRILLKKLSKNDIVVRTKNKNLYSSVFRVIVNVAINGIGFYQKNHYFSFIFSWRLCNLELFKNFNR